MGVRVANLAIEVDWLLGTLARSSDKAHRVGTERAKAFSGEI